MENIKYEDLDLYIPISPFQEKEKLFYLNLILCPNQINKFTDVGISLTERKDTKLIFWPLKEFIHVYDLKFTKIKTKDDFKEYFVCKCHNDPYIKYCKQCLSLSCSKCNQCHCYFYNNDEFYSLDKLNWDIFKENKNTIIKLIKKIIQEFFPNALSQFNENEFCNISKEKIFDDKVNNLFNDNIYEKEFLQKLKLLILDLNFFMTSALKIFSSKKYMSIYCVVNLFMFQKLSLPISLELEKEKEEEGKVISNIEYQHYLVFKTFKKQILSSLNNFIKLEKYIRGVEVEGRLPALREDPKKSIVIKIEGKDNILLLTNARIQIFDLKGNLLYTRYYSSYEELIQISENTFLAKYCYRMSLLKIIYNENNIPIDIKEKELPNNYDNKIKYIKEENILISINENYLFFYKIKDTNNFECTFINELELTELVEDDEEKVSLTNFIYNKYNSSLIFTKSNFFYIFIINIIDLNTFSVTKKYINKEIGDHWYYYSLSLKKINDEVFLLIFFNSGLFLNFSLKTYEIINSFELVDKNFFDKFQRMSNKYFILDSCDKNDIVALSGVNGFLGVFKINESLEIIKEDKLKNAKLDKFKNKQYKLFHLECVDNKYIIIGFWEVLTFFQDIIFFIPNIKVININS